MSRHHNGPSPNEHTASRRAGHFGGLVGAGGAAPASGVDSITVGGGRQERVSGGSLTMADGNPVSQAAKRSSRLSSSPSVNEDSEPRLANTALFNYNFWDGSLAGSHLVIKIYRIYSGIDFMRVRMRFRMEWLACSRLSHRNIVTFRATYTTSEHQLALVCDFTGHRNLLEYLMNKGGIGRLRLLTDVSRGLSHMHRMSIIHGNITTIKPLGVTNTPDSLATSQWNIPVGSSGFARMLLSYGTIPELVQAQPPGSRVPTRESDIYAFAILAWEFEAFRLALVVYISSETSDTTLRGAVGRITFREEHLDNPLHFVRDFASTLRPRSGALRLRRLFIVAGRSRRMATDSHTAELKGLSAENRASIGGEATKTIGDVSTTIISRSVGDGVPVVHVQAKLTA